MGLGSKANVLNPNAGELIGKAESVVEPRAVSAMADAFRSGQITAQDIMDRVSERSRLKEKADVMALQEQMAPQAQQARQVAMQAQAAAAKAALENSALAQQTQKTMLQQANFKNMLGPNGEMIMAAHTQAGQLLPVKRDEELGIEVPDVDAIKKNMAEFNEWMTANQAAQQDAANWQPFKTTLANGQILTGFENVTMRPDDPNRYRRDKPQIRPVSFSTWMQSQQPGTSNLLPTDEPLAPAIEPKPVVELNSPAANARAQVYNKLVEQGAPDANARTNAMSEAEVQAFLGTPTATPAVVQPQQAPPTVQPQAATSAVPDLFRNLAVEKEAPEKDPASRVEFLSNRFAQNPLITGFSQAKGALDAAQGVISNIQPNGTYAPGYKVLPRQADYTLMVNFAKILDPNSVVREGEITLLNGTASAWKNVENAVNNGTFSEMVNKLLGKQNFTPEERISFKTLLNSAYQGRVKAAQELQKTNIDAATKLGVDPTVLQAYFPLPKEAATAVTGAASASPGANLPLTTIPGKGEVRFDRATGKYYAP